MARTAIKRAFVEQYKKKSFDCITVKEVCLAAPVARTTFYGIYQNIYDVRTEIEDELLAGIIRQMDELQETEDPEKNFKQFFMRTVSYIECHWDIIYVFLVQQPDSQLIVKWKTAIKQNFSSHYVCIQSQPEKTLLLEAIAAAAMDLYIYWLQHPSEIQAEQICKFAVKIFAAMQEAME